MHGNAPQHDIGALRKHIQSEQGRISGVSALGDGGRMATHWDFAYLLPHALFAEPIERGVLALVPPDDSRLISLANSSPAVAKLASAFTDQFGSPIHPSALLIRSDAPSTVDFYGVASFRNCIAISAVVDAWVRKLTDRTGGYPGWADYFDFYPFTISADGELIAQSVASMEMNAPNEFRGQRAPHLPSSEHLSFGVDQLVLDRCLEQWERRFIRNRKERKTRVLFRSLEIACQAMRLPAVGTRTPTVHDIGTGIALWVSAFEILSHPRGGDSNLKTVIDLLARAEWLDQTLRAVRYKTKYRKCELRVNLVQKVYRELYNARNDFVHGNPVTRNRLYPMRRDGGPTLLECAPLVYRAALLAYLPTEQSGVSGRDPATELASRMLAQMSQSRYESAVLRCRPKR